MSAPVSAPWRETALGFCGKIPARGDFVRLGLPRGFAEAWNAWIADRLAASRARLGEAWLPAWLEAPVWRFALSAGLCGPDAAVGLWMPSVDRVGRHFPLTIAAVAPGIDPLTLAHDCGAALAAAEAAGREAIASDLAPEDLVARLSEGVCRAPADAGIDPSSFPQAGSLWWTEGGPRVRAAAFAAAGLPDRAAFAAMLDDSAGETS